MPAAAGAVLLLPLPALACVCGLLVLVAGWEWTALAAIQGRAWRGGYLLVLVAAMLLVWAYGLDVPGVELLLLLGCGFWLLAALGLIRPQVYGPGFKAVAGVLVLVPAWGALLILHRTTHGSHWTLFLLGLMWVADSAAYFAGRRYGRVLLAPRISPGKTRAGLYGALLATTCYAAAGAVWFALPMPHWMVLIGVCLVATLASVLGDLFESQIKRQAGLKDSGRWVPGHGGLLDRIDSLTAAAPVFVVAHRWWGV